MLRCLLSVHFCADSFCHRSVLCHRPGANVQILLPEAQSKSHQLLPGRCACGSDWLANHRRRSGDLRFLPLIQVSCGRKKRTIFVFLSWIIVRFFGSSQSVYVKQGLLPSGSGLHQAGTCDRVPAQLTRHRWCKYHDNRSEAKTDNGQKKLSA